MPVNPYFNHLDCESEQQLHETMVQEVIQSFGMDVRYMPRTDGNVDYLFGEDKNPLYENSIEIEAILFQFDSWEGEREIISRFGMDIRDKVKIQFSKRRFLELVGDEYNISKPREGDIIFGLMGNNQLWEVTFVDDESPTDFYQFGRTYVWEVSCELFRYSQENISTGRSDIDGIASSLNIDSLDDLDNVSDMADNDDIEDEGLDTVNFDEQNPFGNF